MFEWLWNQIVDMQTLATGVLHVPRDGFWLVASYISLAGPTQTVPVDEQVKDAVCPGVGNMANTVVMQWICLFHTASKKEISAPDHLCFETTNSI